MPHGDEKDPEEDGCYRVPGGRSLGSNPLVKLTITWKHFLWYLLEHRTLLEAEVAEMNGEIVCLQELRALQRTDGHIIYLTSRLQLVICKMEVIPPYLLDQQVSMRPLLGINGIL